ncbi:unnamed protein product, partial [Prorocentrum cordatum]
RPGRWAPPSDEAAETRPTGAVGFTEACGRAAWPQLRPGPPPGEAAAGACGPAAPAAPVGAPQEPVQKHPLGSAESLEIAPSRQECSTQTPTDVDADSRFSWTASHTDWASQYGGPLRSCRGPRGSRRVPSAARSGLRMTEVVPPARWIFPCEREAHVLVSCFWNRFALSAGPYCLTGCRLSGCCCRCGAVGRLDSSWSVLGSWRPSGLFFGDVVSLLGSLRAPGNR